MKIIIKMKNISILLILFTCFSVQMSSQVRKPNRAGSHSKLKFEFKEGVHKLNIPGTKSFLSIVIKDRPPKIVSITRTMKGKSYRLRKVNSSNYKIKCACNSEYWEDPKTKQLIGVCEPCSADEDEITGQIEFLGPDMKD